METVTNFIIDGKTWYKGKDVGNVLNYADTKQVIRKLVAREDKLTLKELQPHINHKANDGNTIYINFNGLKSLLVKSRKID